MTDHLDGGPADGLGDELRRALDDFCSLPRVLVASDYDGCLAPIKPRPDLAVPDPDARNALLDCASRRDTLVALVSGRGRDDLAAMSQAGPPVVLVGSHGAEFEDGFDTPLTDDQQALLDRIVAEFRAISEQFAGTSVEVKPASTTLHVRNATADNAAAALVLAECGPAGWSGVHVTQGKAVIELAVIETSKGAALDRLRKSFGADAVLYLGDDVTDEKAFAHLERRDAADLCDTARDVGIKVGAGPTVAQYRIAGTDQVTDVLAYVAAHRPR